MGPHSLHKSQLAIAIMAISAGAVQAENISPSSPTLLNQVTVSATRTERQLDDVASSVSVISAEDAEKQMVRDIRDLVKYEPGVNVTDGERFGLGSFNVRGLDQNRVKITVDGVDQAQAFGYEKFIQSQRNFFDIENMKAVEVVKGPASTMHGSGAIGGVVAFVTKDPADYLKSEGDDTSASVKAGYSSADSSHNQTMTLANRTGDLESMLIYTHRKGNETKTHSGGVGGKSETREEADPMNLSSQSLLGKMQYQINDDHQVGLTAEWLDSQSDTELYSVYGTTTQSPVHNYGDFTSEDRATKHRVGVFHQWEADTTVFDSLEWSLNWQNSKSRQQSEVERLLVFGDRHYDLRQLDYTYEETSWQFDTTFTKEVFTDSTDHFITYGFNFENKEQDNLNKTTTVGSGNTEIERYAPVATTGQYGLFIQDEISLMNDRLVITPGLRYDRFDISTQASPEYQDGKDVGDRSHNSWTGRLGSIYNIDDNISVFGQYSQGFSVPDLFALYFERHQEGVVHILANPDLKPERSQSFEAGIRGNYDLGSMELTAFYNTYENFIEQVFVGNTVGLEDISYQYQNLDDTTIKGIEFKGLLHLDQVIGAPQGTRFNTAIAWSHGRGTLTNSDGEIFKDEPLNSIAPLTGVFALGYDAPGEDWGSELSLTLVAEKKRSDISNTDSDSDMGDLGGEQFAAPGYGLVDLTAYYKPHQDVTINAGIFNIGDKKYWSWDDVRGYSSSYAGINRLTQPGRNYSVSVKWEI